MGEASRAYGLPKSLASNRRRARVRGEGLGADALLLNIPLNGCRGSASRRLLRRRVSSVAFRADRLLLNTTLGVDVYSISKKACISSELLCSPGTNANNVLARLRRATCVASVSSRRETSALNYYSVITALCAPLASSLVLLSS